MRRRRVARVKPSLRSRLVRHVVIPLVLTWALGTAAVLAMANYFAGEAFDRSLLDDAYALAAHVRTGPSGLTLNLTPSETSTLLFDQSESVYFAVFGAGPELVAGHAGLHAAAIPSGARHEFADVQFKGNAVRTVSLRREQPETFIVVMAQTTASRTQLLRRLLAYSALPQVMLLLFLAWWLRRIIGRDLQPLALLQQAVDRRDAGDLGPLPDAATTGASTSDVQRLATALNSLLSRLEQSVAAQREFAGNVAHELRTPLARIRAQASYALGQREPSIWQEQLQGIAQGEQQASRLVDQLLAIARAAEGAAGLNLESLALNELARDVLLRCLSKADALGVDLGGEGLDEPVHVRGDKALIEGILNNLLDNALRYGRAKQPRVTVAVHQRGTQAVLSVIDNGPGLDRDEAAQLRSRWVRGSQAHQLGQGTGLGLAIVGLYAELLGAQFALEAAPGGTGLQAVVRFTIAGSVA